MNGRIAWAWCLLVTTLCVGVAAEARAATGRVQGTITDQSGAAVVAATVEARGLDGGLVTTAVTDASGRYAFDALPAGRYAVTATSPGFESSVRSDVAVGAGRASVVDLVLAIAKQEALVVVTAPAASRECDVLPSEIARTSDTAALLENVPGVSINGGGGVSGLPAIHGMADDRVKVIVNGMSVQSACANHMNPPLSYVDPANVGRISVVAGVTPVSNGGDSIGGTVTVDAPAAEFAKPGGAALVRASVSTFYRDNGGVNVANASVSAATSRVRVAYTGSYVTAGNYTSGAGTIVKSTFYESVNHAAQVAVRDGAGILTVNLGVQRVPQEGFVNARMDMRSNTSRTLNGRYERLFGATGLDARAYVEHTDHEMNILRDKIPGMNMPMDTQGTNAGYSVKLRIPLAGRDTVSAGSELHHFRLDDWWPPVSTMVGSMGPDTLWTIRHGRRTRLGLYGEWERRRDAWTTLVGVRTDSVFMNTGDVTGYNMSTTTTGSAAYYADAVEFNAKDHARRDFNVDATALVRVEPHAAGTYEVGYARKTRAPSLYERYLWVKRSNMSVQMNGWFGDGNGYTGNLDLEPEVAHTVSATAGWHDAGKKTLDLTVTPYYTFVEDYIDVDRCPVIAGSNGCTAAKLAATTGFVNLVFANHDARTYGVDLSGRALLGGSLALGSFTVNGVVSYVRGRNLDHGDNLYRLMPLNARLTLEHTRGSWTGAVAWQAVAAKRDVQAARIELPTPGYALVNVRGGYEWPHLRIDAGVENLFDRNYLLPLGGRYWIGDKTGGSSVPGMGRTIFGGVTVKL